MALAKRFRSRLRELAESCSALSKPAEATADPPPVDDAPPVGQLH
jgi:hypothetical protein